MPADVPNRTAGDGGIESAYNKLRENARSHHPVGGPGINTSHTVHGVMREPELPLPPYDPAQQEAASVNIQKFTISTVLKDVLKCTDGTYVAKVALLRCSMASRTIDGVVINYSYDEAVGSPTRYQMRIASSANQANEVQVVVPRWIAGDEIWALKNPTVLFQTLDGTTTVDVSYIQLDETRAWALAAGTV